MAETVTVKERLGGIYTNEVSVRGHKLLADEPESYGSADLGPSPFEYLSAALGACTIMTLRMYAGRKKWAVDHIGCEVVHKKEKIEGELRDVFIRQITLTGDLDVDQRARMIEIAEKCPVHKTLHSGAHIETTEVI